MKYMGSKTRFASDIIATMKECLDNTDTYIEPFAGGMNMICNITKEGRFANDSNPYLIAMFQELQKGWCPPEYVSRDEYEDVRNNKDTPKHIKGWVGFNCSYSGKWFGGFAGKTNTKQGVRNYQDEARRNVLKQMKSLEDVVFTNESYINLVIPENSVVYCDPPYYGTTKYFETFDHNLFWEWVRGVAKSSKVFVSEYSAPQDFTCIWEKKTTSSLSANGFSGGSKTSTEKLFILKE